jgi:acetylornithine deacetylase/succinyl-diaminopimelate desuccinylase-like protein
MAHALASIVSHDGRILVPGWTPTTIPNSVRDACARVVVEDLPGTPIPEPWWGEPGLTRPERIYMWTSVIVLASITGQPEAPVNAVSGTARARIQIRHTVDVPAETIAPSLRAHLDAHGLHMVQIIPVTERDNFLASRTDPDNPWVQRVIHSLARTAGRPPNVIPTNSASGPSEFFKAELQVPVMWIPHSYGGCGQHGPDEHGLGTLFRDGLGLMAGVFWDLGEAGLFSAHV